jgi:hypothetical protein
MIKETELIKESKKMEKLKLKRNQGFPKAYYN